ncbi:uncharacterized protein LOC114744170 [Neltuma alba]|uniref:uncharacterized protein LOC114744170 n=1 Tax=Neltuma alba TaxID=207710 RepID=UPI0010A34A11|nr:uncharacterized protein LOC114744170 [Prosopis alba]
MADTGQRKMPPDRKPAEDTSGKNKKKKIEEPPQAIMDDRMEEQGEAEQYSAETKKNMEGGFVSYKASLMGFNGVAHGASPMEEDDLFNAESELHWKLPEVSEELKNQMEIYPVVPRWSPYFNPHQNPLRRVATWVRIPDIPMHYYNSHCITRIGDRIGRTLKVDINTLSNGLYTNQTKVERGKYARICVELDLQKKLVPRVIVAGEIFNVEYEGLGVICFACGRFGHRREACPWKVSMNTQEPSASTSPPIVVAPSRMPEKNKADIDETFGVWMLAGKSSRAQFPKYGEQKTGLRTTAGQPKDKRTEKMYVQKSRFSIFEDWEDTEQMEATLPQDTNKETASQDAEGKAIVLYQKKRALEGVKEQPRRVRNEQGRKNAHSSRVPTKDLGKENQPPSNGPNLGLGPDKNIRNKATEVASQMGQTKQIKQKSQRTHRVVMGNVEQAESKIDEAQLSKMDRCNTEELHIPSQALALVMNINVEQQGQDGTGSTQGSMLECIDMENLNPKPPDPLVENSARLEGGMIEESSDVAKEVGAGSRSFPILIRDIVKKFQVDILCLEEPRVSGKRADSVVKRLGFSHWIRVEASGYSGGIWLLWNNTEFSVTYICSSAQFIHCKVSNRSNPNGELITFVYGETNTTGRMMLWDSLRLIAGTVTEPWLVCGDFNAYMSPGDKEGGSRPNEAVMTPFRECIADCGLVKCETRGDKFTWERTGLKERLDWVFHNAAWSASFPRTFVTHEPRFKSDHRILVINSNNNDNSKRRQRTFVYQAAWELEDDFKDIISTAWNGKTWLEGVKTFHKEALKWHEQQVGNLVKKKKELMKRLVGIDRERRLHDHPGLRRLEEKIWGQYQKIILQEEIQWYQRSRCKWLQWGDRNTRFFHASTILERKK